MAKSPETQSLYSAEFSSQFCPPRTFSEFYVRYPRVIRTRLRSKWKVADQNLDDWEHDVCVHLIALPTVSVFVQQGCIDRIATYDAEKRGGGSEVLFISYVHLLIDNFCRSVLRRQCLFTSTVSFSELVCCQCSDDSPDHDELLAKLSSAFRVDSDPVMPIFWKELAARARTVDPAFAHAISTLMAHSNQRDAASHMGVTDKVFACMLKHVKALARGDQLPRRRRSQRRAKQLAMA